MKFVKLPSGKVINMDQVVALDPRGACVVAYSTETDDEVTFTGADAAMLLAWMEKRPLLVPPPRGKKA